MIYNNFRDVNTGMLKDTYRHRGLRNKLVNTILSKGIKSESVIEAVRRVPRHFFFDDAFLEHAYQDKAFPIDEGQTISQPYTVAFQTELLDIRKGDRVLEIGTGSGYQACILCEMKAEVYSIEYNKKLYKKTRQFLPEIGYNPHLFHGDGTNGLQAFAPYDKIIVTAGSPAIPETLKKQLAVDGKMIIPVGNMSSQTLKVLTKTVQDEFEIEEIPLFAFVPLIGREGWKE